MLLVLAVGQVAGAWQIHLRQFPDTKEYLAVGKMELRDELGSVRTLGYPLLLAAVRRFDPDYGIVPYIHLAALFLAVFLFYGALRRFGLSGWQALAASSGVLYGATNWMIGALLTDLLGQVFAVTTIAFLIWLATDRRSLVAWCGLTGSVAAAYHVRPAYLILVPLAPCLGVMFLRLRARLAPAALRWKSLFLGISAVSLLPYVAFCLLRLALVGHFGLVSFAGQQFAAFAVELLDADMIDNQLPERFRPLAREILAERQRLGNPSVFRGGWQIDIAQWERTNYNANIYRVAKPAAIRVFGDNHVVWDRELRDFSRHVISLRKWPYLQLYAYSVPRTPAKLLYRSWILQALVPMAILLAIVYRWLCRRRNKTYSLTLHERVGLSLMAHLAILYFCVTMGMVLLILFAESRYVLPAGIFVPGLFALLILYELKAIHSVRLQPQPGLSAATAENQATP
jgi:hypothetical protein